MAGRFSKRRKFSATWTPDRKGVMHPSKGEADWTNRLYDREDRGEIRELNLFPSWDLNLPNVKTGELEHVCKIKGDASFFDIEAGRVRFQDYKADEGNTDVSVLKRDLLRVCLGIDLELAGPAGAKARKAAELKDWKALARAQDREKKRAEKEAAKEAAKQAKRAEKNRSTLI